MLEQSRFRGALLGLAIGDALGTTLEFRSPGTFTPLTDIVGGGPFSLKPGEWTDDTSMALCMAESLVRKQGFDAGDQMELYCDWWERGHLSVKGRCFDIGNTTRAALSRYKRSSDPFSGDDRADAAGNGSLMRLVPIVLAFANDPTEAIRLAGESSRTTHAAIECVDSCKLYASIILAALHGASREELLFNRHPIVSEFLTTTKLTTNVQAIADGSFRTKSPPSIRGSGYVVQSLEAALWAFATTTDFREGALAAANLGDDADTTGAVFGQLAGAFYSNKGIPESWRNMIAMRELILTRADELHTMAQPKPTK